MDLFVNSVSYYKEDIIEVSDSTWQVISIEKTNMRIVCFTANSMYTFFHFLFCFTHIAAMIFSMTGQSLIVIYMQLPIPPSTSFQSPLLPPSLL